MNRSTTKSLSFFMVKGIFENQNYIVSEYKIPGRDSKSFLHLKRSSEEKEYLVIISPRYRSAESENSIQHCEIERIESLRSVAERENYTPLIAWVFIDSLDDAADIISNVNIISLDKFSELAQKEEVKCLGIAKKYFVNNSYLKELRNVADIFSLRMESIN